MSTVEINKVVSIRYVLKDADGDILQEVDDGDSIDYVHGTDSMVRGLEQALAGKTVGTRLQVVVSPEDGYGERDDSEPQPVPREAFGDEEILPGMPILAEDDDGEQTQLWIVDVDDDEVLVDTNHPLAGETLYFDVEIIGLRDATPEEIEHGHVHDGHELH